MQEKGYEERIRQDAAGYGITLTASQARLMVEHLELVEEKNRELNLTSITSVDEAVDLHVADSLLFLTQMPGLSDTSLLLDIGTGAGFPGIPLTIATGCTSTMIDSVRKKTEAVLGFCKKLGIESKATCEWIRAEELAYKRLNYYNYVVARAVAELRVLIEYAAPLLRMGGFLVSSKGRVSPEEEEEAERTAPLCGMVLVSRETFSLPSERGLRELYLYQKVEEPRVSLPRRPGKAKKSPLRYKGD